ncbi:hypothetical protein C0J52_04970 [Blattella germanica]|nr:hypothetical protein C0J52_04970 [Blattella germanica]
MTSQIAALEKQLSECKTKMEEDKKDAEEAEQVNQCLVLQLRDCQQVIDRDAKKLAHLRQEKENANDEPARVLAGRIMTLKEQLGECRAKLAEKKETEEVNKLLAKQVSEYQKVIASDGQMMAQLRQEKAKLERDHGALIEAHNKLLQQNARITRGLAPQDGFKDLLDELEHKIVSLEIEQEDAANQKRVQAERIKSIAESIEVLDVEAGRLKCERKDVTAIRGPQEKELAETVEKLENLQGWTLVSTDPSLLKVKVNELTLFVESSTMRISEIDQRLKEIDEEKTVLVQQREVAIERKHSCERQEIKVHQEMVELQEQERTIVREQGGWLANLQDRLDLALVQNSEMLATGLSQEEELALARKEKAKLQLQLQGGSTCQEQDLKMRLQMAAAEYRKLYTEKEKVEKKLKRLHQKLGERKSKSAPAGEEPATAELISLSQPSGSDSKNDLALPAAASALLNNMTCPICSEMFPPGASDLFRQHFESHLS